MSDQSELRLSERRRGQFLDTCETCGGATIHFRTCKFYGMKRRAPTGVPPSW